MKLVCNIPEFEHCFVELSDRWTRGEVRQFRTAPISQVADLVVKKMVAVHLDCADGNHITEPAHFTDERLENVDVGLYYWIPGALIEGLTELENLGFRAGLKQSDTTAANSAPPPTSQA